MSMLTSIVAIDSQGAIGCKNALPWTLKSDLAFFKQQTIGNAIVMGRKTYQSIGKCLPGRENIVLSHNQVLFNQTDDCKVAVSIDEVFYRISKSKKNDIFIVGGAQTYLQFADYVDRYLVTFVDHAVRDADAFVDRSIMDCFEQWEKRKVEAFTSQSGRDDYPFEIYEVIAPDSESRRAKRLQRVEKYRENVSKPKFNGKSGKPKFIGSQEVFAF